MTTFRVFIGYDSRQPLAYTVAAHTVAKYAAEPVAITRLQLNQLPITRKGLTEFTYSRYLVPWLCGYEGVALFLDADVLCQADVTELLAYPLAYPEHDVFVVPHDALFERPSVMLFNAARCQRLTPDFIEANPKELYALRWASSVGTLPHTWNHLVGYDAPRQDANLIHFTQGIPCWPETQACEWAEAWRAERDDAFSTVSFKALMGHSVHPLARQVG
jgi:lipopolysaccharide biosynthesis glycosyltransferase